MQQKMLTNSQFIKCYIINNRLIYIRDSRDMLYHTHSPIHKYNMKKRAIGE